MFAAYSLEERSLREGFSFRVCFFYIFSSFTRRAWSLELRVLGLHKIPEHRILRLVVF